MKQRSALVTNALTVLMVGALQLSVVTAHAETIRGHVVGISDGDTVKVLTINRTEVKVRLAGIDAPEKRQAFGE